ncbi:MAG: energy transducer TonB [Phycisphaeraceae bacterium]
MNDALKPSGRLPRSGRFVAVGSFSVGWWNAVAWSVLIHAGAIFVALWTWDMRADQRATPLFAPGEQSVTVTNLRFISAAELEEMEHPEVKPPPPEVMSDERRAMSDEPIANSHQKSEIRNQPSEIKNSPAPGSGSDERRAKSDEKTEAPSPPISNQKSEIRNSPSPRTPAPEPPAAHAAAPTGVTRGAAVAELTVPKYPMISRRLNEQGLVVLAVTVDARGHVTGIEVLSDPGYPRLVEAAKNAARQARFIPAMRDGEPVADTVRVPFRFRLSGS